MLLDNQSNLSEPSESDSFTKKKKYRRFEEFQDNVRIVPLNFWELRKGFLDKKAFDFILPPPTWTGEILYNDFTEYERRMGIDQEYLNADGNLKFTGKR